MGMDHRTQYDNNELFQLTAEGDRSAFVQLFRSYLPRLASFVSSITKSDHVTDDVLQEIFMRVWFTREKLMGVKDPETWLYRIASSVAYAALKKLITDNKILSVVHHESYYGTNDIVETARLYTLASEIRQAVRQLDVEQKMVYKLSRDKGMKVPDIAEELSVSPNNVRNLLASSMDTIHDHLESRGHAL
jgi:RNA polymerase sigma factor (sigma-70 family)